MPPPRVLRPHGLPSAEFRKMTIFTSSGTACLAAARLTSDRISPSNHRDGFEKSRKGGSNVRHAPWRLIACGRDGKSTAG